MPPPSPLPAKTVCLSLCSLSRRQAPSNRFCAARAAPPSSAHKLISGADRAGILMQSSARELEKREGHMADYDIKELKRRMQGALTVLKTELNGLRTGRASAHLLDPIHVDAYGQSMALNQLATVSIPQPRMLSVQ